MKQFCRLSTISAFMTALIGVRYGASGYACAAELPGNPPTPAAIAASQCDPSAQRPVTVSAKTAIIMDNGKADFAGDVVVCLQDGQLSSDAAQFSRNEKTMRAEGNISYHNETIKVHSKSLEANIAKQSMTLNDSSYVLAGNVGRGAAKQLKIEGQKQLILNNGTFTTCPVDDQSWQLSADEITFESEDGWAEARGAAIKIHDIPVIYIPYFTFPLDERRKSGFLPARQRSSVKHGIELITPWYWNIAPNLDATFTPRLMTKRGLQLQSEFRYLFDHHQGLLNLELLPQDDERKDLDARHLLHWQHRSDYGDRIRAFVDFTQISDDAYLNDLGSKHQDSSDSQVNRHFELSYFSNNIDSAFRIEDFKVLGQQPSSYRALPQLDFSNRSPYELGVFDFNWFAQLSHFSNSDPTVDITRANRFHVEPSLSYNYSSPAMTLSSELSLLQTHYQQTYAESAQALDDSPSRTLPKFRFHSLINFERPSTLLGKNGLQTFEPQLQYLYIPDKFQDDIGLFDSTRLQDDYYGLFRDNRFSGLDRIGDANQITLGATTRFFDQHNNEVFHLSLGQILYFDRNRQSFTANDSRIGNSKSELAAEVFMRWSKRWDLNGNVQYDDDAGQISQSHLSLNYRANKYTLAQLNHRYTRSVSGNKIEQVGIMTGFELADQWQFVAGYQRDLTNHRSIDSYFGLQYESCCWAIRLVSNRHINTNLAQLAQTSSGLPSSFDSGISLSFTIKGINGSHGFDISEMFREGIFGKRRRYFLNN